MVEDEKTPEEENSSEDQSGNTGEGSKLETDSIIDRAHQAAERLEKANAKQEELLKKQEDLMARQVLAGRSEAGGEPAKKKQITDEEYAEKAISGEFNKNKE